MKIKLIQPSVGKIKDEKYVRTWQMEPLGIATIAGLTPDDHDIDFVDDRFDEINYDDGADLVGITVETYTAQRAYKIAEGFRERGIPVVMGGIHASLATDEVKDNCDAIVVGGAEFTWAKVLEDAEKGKLESFYREPRPGKGDELLAVSPRREIFDGKPYLPLKMIETGRGCPFVCDFCAIAGSYEQSYVSKSIDDIVQAVDEVDGRFVYFSDDNFVSRFGRTKDLCDALAPLGKSWFSHGSINMADDTELLRKLEKSGCMNILIGFESLNPETLKDMGKSWNIQKRGYSEALGKLRDHGITVYGTFVFGYDNDTIDDFERTLEFAIEQKLALAAFNHLVPFPKTPLYERFKKDGRLKEDKWWLREGYRFGQVAFEPKNMTAEELTEGCYDLRKKFYSVTSTAKRMWEFSANSKTFTQAVVGTYSNLASNFGVQQRQAWPIGSVVTREELDHGELWNPWEKN